MVCKFKNEKGKDGIYTDPIERKDNRTIRVDKKTR